LPCGVWSLTVAFLLHLARPSKKIILGVHWDLMRMDPAQDPGLPLKNGQDTAIMVNRPSPSATRRNLPHWQTQQTTICFVVARRSWAATGLFLHYMRWDNRNTPSISQMSVLEAPLCFVFICMGYHWESSESSGKAEKRSNCQIGSNIMHE